MKENEMKGNAVKSKKKLANEKTIQGFSLGSWGKDSVDAVNVNVIWTVCH